MLKLLKVILFNLLVILLLVEGAAFLYFKLGLSASTYKPSYISKAHDSEQEWMTESNDWGAWHKPNGKANISRRCFSVDLLSNSYGARDIERTRQSDKERVVVLGDSFVEGYGVWADKRFTNLLEYQTGMEFLNFGASGSFGPVQYTVLYRDLASTFSHNHVLIGLLPDNDFTDNDAEFWQRTDSGSFNIRYRPYWKPGTTQDSFEIYYPAQKPEKTVTFADYKGQSDSGPSLKSKIQRLFWTYGVYREVRYFTRGSSLKAGTYSGYFDATEQQVRATKYFLKEIKRLAGNKKVSVFSIPRLSDLQKLQKQSSPIITELKAFADRNQIGFIDLAPAMLEKETALSDLFLPCDGHWSNKGHAVASEILKKSFFK
jgi:hypothetical protein